MEQHLGSTVSPQRSRTTMRRYPFRFRKTIIAVVIIGCLVGGAVSVGLSPVVTYLGELSRQKLAAQRIFLSYGEVSAEGLAVTLRRVSLQLPDYQIAEQFDSVSIGVKLKQLLRLRPHFSIRVIGFGGGINAEIDPLRSDSTIITNLTLDRIALRSSATLAPIGLTNGILSGSMSLHREPSSECDSLSPPCYTVKIEANQLEKGQGSELPLPKTVRDAVSLPGFPLGSSLFIPPIPRTNFSISLSTTNARTVIHSVTLRTTGIELSGMGSIPVGTGGPSSIGWYENMEATGSVQLDKTIGGFLSVFLRSSQIKGSLAPETPTNFVIAGPLLSPKVTFTQAERTVTKANQSAPPQGVESASSTPG